MKRLIYLLAVVFMSSLVLTSCGDKKEVVKKEVKKEIVKETPKPKPVVKDPSEILTWSHTLPGEFDFETLKPYLEKYECFIISVEDDWFELANLEAVKDYLDGLTAEEVKAVKIQVKEDGRLKAFQDGSIKWLGKDGQEKETREDAHKRRGHKFDKEAAKL